MEAILVADLIGSKRRGQEPGGLQEIEQLRRSIQKSMLDFLKPASAEGIEVELMAPEGDNVLIRIAGASFGRLASLSAAALIRTLTNHDNGRQFRYIAYPAWPARPYQPLRRAIDNIAKTESGQGHYLILHEEVVRSVEDARVSGWLKKALGPREVFDIPGESASAQRFAFFAPVALKRFTRFHITAESIMALEPAMAGNYSNGGFDRGAAELQTHDSAPPPAGIVAEQFYSGHRVEMQRAMLWYYRQSHETQVPSFPLICLDRWLPRRLTPLEEITCELQQAGARGHPLFPPFRHKGGYAQFRQELGYEVENRPCYRLLGLDVRGAHTHLVFSNAKYHQYVNSLEVLGWELAMWMSDPQKDRSLPTPADLPWRGPPEHIWTLTNRFAVAGVNCLLINFFAPNSAARATALLHDRSKGKAAEARFTHHVVPAGTHAPASVGSFTEDYTLVSTVLRELAEELLGAQELNDTNSRLVEIRREPILRPFIEGLARGAAKLFYLGAGFDPVTTKPEILVAMAIDWRKLEGFDSEMLVDNFEGSRYEIQFEPRTLSNLVEFSEDLLPAGAACLLLAARHYDAMLAEFGLCRADLK